MVVSVDQLGSPFGIECGNAQSVITHNFTHSSSPINGGIQSDNRNGLLTYTNEDISSSQPYLTSDAAVANQGSAELIYNDLDGSLNDIGAYGGHSYDPSGRTTTNPVILSGAVSAAVCETRRFCDGGCACCGGRGTLSRDLLTQRIDYGSHELYV